MSLAKVKSTVNFKRIKLAISKAISNPSLLAELAKGVKQRIYSFTKRGISLVTEDKLNPLSKSYVKWRKTLGSDKPKQKRNYDGFRQKKLAIFKKKKTIMKLGDFFSPARSNLTLTGQMLDALSYELDSTKAQFSVFVKDTKRSGDEKTNKEVAVEVAKEGRPFLGLDQKGLDLIRRKAIADLRRKLKR